MPARLRVQRRQRSGQYVVRFEGAVDGSSACHALELLAHAPDDARELVLDLSALTQVEAFGPEVLSRGLRQLTRQRQVRIQVPGHLVSALTFLTEDLFGTTPSDPPQRGSKGKPLREDP